MKYRKKPLVVEAVQLLWSTWDEMCAFVDKESFVGGVYLDEHTFEELPEGRMSQKLGLKIKTLEGVVLTKHYDYVIKGVNGEFYPCREDIFRKTYEEIEEEINEENEEQDFSQNKF